MPDGKNSSGRMALIRQTIAVASTVQRTRAKIIHAAAQTCYRPVGLAGFLTRRARICHLGFPPTGHEIEWAFHFGPEAVIGCYQGQVRDVSDAVRRVSPRSRIVAIPNGVDTTKYSPLPGEISAASAHFRHGARHVVVIVGHLSEVKGYPTFFKAAARVVRRIDSVAFVVVGEEMVYSGYRDHLERLVQNLGIAHCTHFLGWRKDVADVLRAADVMALPSHAEGLPLAVLEAMACGKPIVATPVNGVPEAVIDGRTGILVAPGNDEALAEALIRLFDRPSLARQMGTEGRRRVESHFSLGRFVKKIEALYDVVLTKRAAVNGGVEGKMCLRD
jgi:glycosyltransferase involved in cell wall biosynthesis